MEYVVTMTTQVPEGTSSDAVDEMRTREADRAAQLAAVGFLLRLWRPPLQPGEWRSLGLFAARDASALEDVLSSMPLRVWRTDTVLELEAHPNDPGPTSDDPGPAAASAEFMTKFRLRVPEETADGVVRAAEVALAAGAVGSPHLLLLSGVGPAAQLAEFGIPLVADVPGVGEHLIDHPESVIIWEANQPLTHHLSNGTVTRRATVVPAHFRCVQRHVVKDAQDLALF